MEPKSIKLIFAEDDFLVGKEIERTLKKIGYDIIGHALDGEQAVSMVNELKPDVALLDIHMPKMDGLEAAAKIQDTCPTPVVVLTAHESKDLVDKASDMGVGAYLTKPPNEGELDRAITIAMARHKDLMELHRLYKKIEKQKIDLELALNEIKTLRGIIPICANCKKIRTDDNAWEQIEEYITKHTDADFSHGICPDCKQELYGDFLNKEK